MESDPCFQPLIPQATQFSQLNSDLTQHLNNSVTEAQQSLLNIIAKIASQLRRSLGRSLRVLDLGCGQGFFSLQLGMAGDEVVGIDPLPTNVFKCQELAKELAIPATFIAADTETCLEILPQQGSFDLMLGLGIVSEPWSENDQHQTQQLLRISSQQVAIALITSPYQSSTKKPLKPLPEDPYEILQSFDYLEQIGDCAVGRSELNQPLFFCSNSYWYANGSMQRFDYWTERSRRRFEHEVKNNIHPHQRTRRYYFTETHMLKHYRLTAAKVKSNRTEIQAEINFLKENQSKISTLPQLYAYNISKIDAWMLRQKMPGIGLGNAIQDGVDYDPRMVLMGILQQLALFERHGFYQNDLRPWNFILSANEVFLIDYGTVNQTPRDSLSSKKSIYMSFLILAHEVIHRKVLLLRHFSPEYISPKHFPEAYHKWLYQLLSTDFSQWSFSLFLESFTKPPPQQNLLAADNMQLWLDEVDKRWGNAKFKIMHFQKYFIKKLRSEVRKATWKRKFSNSFIFGVWTKTND